MLAGARSLVAAIAPVRDDAAEAFTRVFYETMTGGKSVLDAHGAAVSATRDLFPHPADWASFVVFGDGASKGPI